MMIHEHSVQMVHSIIKHCHALPCGGHATSSKTSAKYFSLVFIGSLFIKMSMQKCVIIANELTTFLEPTPCP